MIQSMTMHHLAIHLTSIFDQHVCVIVLLQALPKKFVSHGLMRSYVFIHWVPQLFEQLESFHVNKSCKIECCGNKMHQIVQNMILTWGLELKLSLLWRTTISGQHSLFYRWEKVSKPLLSLYFNRRRGSYSFSHL